MSAIALWVLIGALVVLFLYQALIFSRLAFLRPKVEPDRDTPVSVVICARNAMQDLEELVPLLMDQDHGEFEVVVVNDRSDDDTWELLQWLKLEHPRLKPVDLQADEKFSYGKKMALGVGIRSAKHPHILLTDADCRPAGRDWISTMAAGFHNGKELVVAHSPYEHRPGLTNLLERYDGLAKAVQYLAFAKAGLPYMGVGRNLGYTKAVFANAKGQLRHRHLMSGDDDLFVNEVARRGNTAVVVDPRSFMTTRATEGLLAWVRRRRRHFTTASHYRFGHQVLLFLLPLARVAGPGRLLGGHRGAVPARPAAGGLDRSGGQGVALPADHHARHEQPAGGNAHLVVPPAGGGVPTFGSGHLLQHLDQQAPPMEVNENLSEKARYDFALVRRAVDKGDQKAYAELMSRYRDSIYFMLLKMINNKDDAEDLTIEAFGKAFNRLHQYTPNYAFSTWLFKIASNNCIDWIRKQKKKMLSIDNPVSTGDGEEMTIEIRSHGPDPQDVVIREQKNELMREVVEKLKPRYRTLIELRYYKEYSYEEIATELDLPLGTVKAQLFRAREFLLNMMQGSRDAI